MFADSYPAQAPKWKMLVTPFFRLPQYETLEREPDNAIPFDQLSTSELCDLETALQEYRDDVNEKIRKQLAALGGAISQRDSVPLFGKVA